jgi:hypothetical protein
MGAEAERAGVLAMDAGQALQASMPVMGAERSVQARVLAMDAE